MSRAALSPGGVAVGTVVARNYLPFARVLARSLAAHHPEVPLFVLMADEPGGAFGPEVEPFRTVPLAAVGIPELRRFVFRYTRQQVIVAAKPYLLRWLLDHGFERAVFLDADILVLGDLGPLLAPAGARSILLTPHLLSPPVGPDRFARELAVLQAGVYNGGFVAVSGSASARDFLGWWQDRLFRHCQHAVAEGLHYDQRWLDLVPTLFDEVAVIHDPGANVAYWNLPERKVEVRGEAVSVDGRPGRFFHFSGFDPDQSEIVTRYSQLVTTADVGEAAPLFARYATLLLEAGWRETRAWPYAYDRFDDGTAIPDLARRLYGELGETAAAFADPFRTAGEASFCQWLDQPVDRVTRTSHKVTRLWLAVHGARPDVQRAFPDPLGADRKAFLAWATRYGAREHGIPEVFLPGAGRRLRGE